MVNANVRQQFLLLIHRSQQAEVSGIILQHIPRMRPESDDHALITTFPGLLQELL